MNVTKFKKRKERNAPMKMITCYTYWQAKIISNTDIDAVLVGDSVAMTEYGFEDTLAATPKMIARHVASVKRGLDKKKMIIGDLPFLSYRKGLKKTMEAVDLIMKAGANAVKLEGYLGNKDIIKNIINSGVPVMGHLGLTPQHINKFGGYKVQGRNDGQKILKEAKKLEELGCFSLVLECVPSDLAGVITKELTLPVVGIGAGAKTDGQILVFQDALGLNPEFAPKFSRAFTNGFESLKGGVEQFCIETNENTFPNKEESFQ